MEDTFIFQKRGFFYKKSNSILFIKYEDIFRIDEYSNSRLQIYGKDEKLVDIIFSENEEKEYIKKEIVKSWISYYE